MKNLLILSIGLLVLSACADKNTAGVESCSVRTNLNGSFTQVCPNGTSVTWTNGQAGPVGATGAQGDQGPQGNPGTNGSDGAPGHGTIVTPSVADNTICPNGGYIYSFTDSVSGDQTFAPTAICNGLDGAAGTVVTAVQFCPSYGAPTYGNFPEFCFDIGGVIYGTYWDNTNAWTAALSAGAYNSTATGLGCTFVINNNGSITQQ